MVDHFYRAIPVTLALVVSIIIDRVRWLYYLKINADYFDDPIRPPL